ncbi:MAG: LysR family transcriptional regulator [Gammaproteobacteria bacterium]|nr:LysR family transcriptional regulator [Gammaproteobacteria bacterium]
MTMPDYLIRHASLRQLQVFEAIVRLGSFTRAAEELFLTQPTVSMQTKKLADVMGVELFEHVGRNITPTEAGMELYSACRQVFESLANLEMKIDDLKGLKRGHLRIGVITTAKYLAPEMLGQFSRLYPGIELSLKVTNRDRIIERLHANEDNLYITGLPDEDLDIEVFPFAPNPLVVIAPREHPLVGRKNVSLKEVSQEPFIMREPGSGTRDATLRLFNAHGCRPRVRMELGSNEAIKHAVVGGLGLSVLSLHTLLMEGTKGPVAILNVKDFPIMRQWFIVYPRGKELSLVARTFLDFAIASEGMIHERLEALWPGMKQYVSAAKKSAAGRKKKSPARKKSRKKAR